jgi:hypothetical protein
MFDQSQMIIGENGAVDGTKFVGEAEILDGNLSQYHFALMQIPKDL